MKKKSSNSKAGKKAVPSHEELQEKQVKENFKAFQKQLPKLLKEYRGWYAIMRDKEVVAVCKSMDAGGPYARKRFPDDLYSVQLITDKPVRI